MTDPKLTGWIKGHPLKSRPGPYEVALEYGTGKARVFAIARERWNWLGDGWENPGWLRWSHFRGLAKKP